MTGSCSWKETFVSVFGNFFITVNCSIVFPVHMNFEVLTMLNYHTSSLGYNAIWSDGWLPPFHRNLLPSSSQQKYVSLKQW
jgi:hypothetical protein